ncbi:MAG: metal ABC transporter ATP-binding protein [Elusimicrobia bacterium]|nr:metal ABC transporter ATP-binding protein [Elusimicrobiota bacterium]
MSEPLLRLKHASLGYGEQPILTGVDVEVQPGSFIGILGHNGSGKTTLLKTILNLIPCLKGQCVWQGATPDSLRFGYVPQKEKLDPIYPLSAFDVAAMGTYHRFALRIKNKAFIHRCLADCGAAHLTDKRYSDLSGGQKQRVLIARALAAEPQILTLDEPLAGIDITTQKAVLKLLKHLKEERGLTILMVSHRIQAEKGLFTHIVWCDEGKVISGPTPEMLANSKLAEVFKTEL